MYIGLAAGTTGCLPSTTMTWCVSFHVLCLSEALSPADHTHIHSLFNSRRALALSLTLLSLPLSSFLSLSLSLSLSLPPSLSPSLSLLASRSLSL